MHEVPLDQRFPTEESADFVSFGNTDTENQRPQPTPYVNIKYRKIFLSIIGDSCKVCVVCKVDLMFNEAAPHEGKQVQHHALSASNQVEASGQVNIQATCLRRGQRYFEQEAGWTPEPVWTLRKRDESRVKGFEPLFLYLPTCSLVTTTAELSWLTWVSYTLPSNAKLIEARSLIPEMQRSCQNTASVFTRRSFK